MMADHVPMVYQSAIEAVARAPSSRRARRRRARRRSRREVSGTDPGAFART